MLQEETNPGRKDNDLAGVRRLSQLGFSEAQGIKAMVWAVFPRNSHCLLSKGVANAVARFDSADVCRAGWACRSGQSCLTRCDVNAQARKAAPR